MTEPKISQVFCTVADLIADKPAPGASEAALYQKCRDASDYLQKEIGSFIPITRTMFLAGSDTQMLLVPPVLSISSVIYQGLSLVQDVDYSAQPERRRWPCGPYTWLEAAPYSFKIVTWLKKVIYATNITPVVLSGTFGLYDRAVPTGAAVDDVTGQSDSQLTLQVDDGGAVSPGMQLVIGSEQQLVTGWGAPIDSGADLDSAVATANEQTFTLDDASKVHVGETIRVGFEQCKVLDISAAQIYVARGWNKTQAVAHLDAAGVDVYRTVSVERALNGTTAAAHAKTAPIARYAVPDDILFLCKEIATLMLNKALSGYQGRTGNDQGVIFYNDAFPRDDINRIKLLYMIPEAVA